MWDVVEMSEKTISKVKMTRMHSVSERWESNVILNIHSGAQLTSALIMLLHHSITAQCPQVLHPYWMILHLKTYI